MAQLIPERTAVFRIDPQETMVTALRGCRSRSQLEVAYGILLKRLLVAQQTVAKYEAQYQCLEMPLSPISTVPELHEEYDMIEGTDNHMRFMLQKFPHHREQLATEAFAAVAQGHAWTTIHLTQPLPVEVKLSQNSQLSRTDVSLGKKRVEWDDTAPWDDKSSSVEQGRDLEKELAYGADLSFGYQTPFRTNTKFFDTSGSTHPTSFFSTPGAASIPNVSLLPDVTVGLATPS
ncbi:hypothetical protein K443DRAFT_2145 [Laccaria amethystina LaAM-08-1]|uniref:Uncharacterized protein n=1 Tax=Laccaria amethystina LaAM-08-1 TaxID=1095629 RepID=A0A0C9YBF1_9AGAR|nr:hypothetical protein K443DRAFT_2145 [Laccaria amethystina LaAM-08-1]